MRIFVNLLLLLFIADGGVSLLDELVSLFSPVMFLSQARNVLANSVILMALPVYLCLGIDRRLPKRVFIPLILFVFWCPLSAWCFPALAGNRYYGLLIAIAQVALVMLPFSRFRKAGARSPAMPPALFKAPWFSLRNTLVFGAANLFVIPLALALFVLFAAGSYMAQYTAGFMRISPGGLYMTERVYRRDNRTVRLAGMIHVGEKEYYDAMAGSVAPGRTIVLAEGVTDDGNLLRNRLDYGKMAEFLGLTSQAQMRFRGKMIEPEELEEPREGAGEKTPARPADILRADVDVSAFRPPTILLLNTIGRQLQESRSLVKGFLALNAWAEKNITQEMNAIIMDDLLQRRNRVVIGYLGKAVDRYDTVIIP